MINSFSFSPGQKSNFIPVNINTKWKHHAITVAGGHGQGNGLNQLSYPYGIYMDKSNQNIYIADMDNDRIIRWKLNGTKYGEILAGGNGRGNAMNQLYWPTDVVVDEKNDCMFICDSKIDELFGGLVEMVHMEKRLFLILIVGV